MKYRVVFGRKEFKYQPLVGDAYILEATSEATAKRKVREILKNLWVTDYKILWVDVVTK